MCFGGGVPGPLGFYLCIGFWQVQVTRGTRFPFCFHGDSKLTHNKFKNNNKRSDVFGNLGEHYSQNMKMFSTWKLLGICFIYEGKVETSSLFYLLSCKFFVLPSYKSFFKNGLPNSCCSCNTGFISCAA